MRYVEIKDMPLPYRPLLCIVVPGVIFVGSLSRGVRTLMISTVVCVSHHNRMNNPPNPDKYLRNRESFHACVASGKQPVEELSKLERRTKGVLGPN
jgi:hypothetical protein